MQPALDNTLYNFAWMASLIFIIRHWNKQLRVFMDCLDMLNKQYSAEAIHDLRVAIKRLRAYLQLTADPENAYLKSTNALFSLLGQHRDNEESLQLLDEYLKDSKEPLIQFKRHLENAVRTSFDWIQPALADFDGEELRVLSSRLQDQYIHASAEEHGQKLASGIESELNRAVKDISAGEPEAHKLRKRFKEISYQAEICPQKYLSGHLPLNVIKKALVLLGDWQDHDVLGKKARHFRKDLIPKALPEHGQLKKLEKSIDLKKHALLDDCRALFKDQ